MASARRKHGLAYRHFKIRRGISRKEFLVGCKSKDSFLIPIAQILAFILFFADFFAQSGGSGMLRTGLGIAGIISALRRLPLALPIHQIHPYPSLDQVPPRDTST